MKIREKQIRSGKTLEIEFYSVTADGKRYSRGKKKKTSRAVQKKLNDNNARKYLRRLLDENFVENQDYYCTYTYRNDEMPVNYAEVKRDVNNFLRRLRRARNKEDLPELKYIYAVECTVSKRTGIARWHLHFVLSGGLPRKLMKDLWGKGDIKKVEELQSNEYGFAGLAQYLCKEWNSELLPKGRKRYNPSRNLKPPKEKKKDGVFTKPFLEKLCMERVDDIRYWEHRYKDKYRFISATPEYNEDYGTWSLSVFMRKKE